MPRYQIITKRTKLNSLGVPEDCHAAVEIGGEVFTIKDLAVLADDITKANAEAQKQQQVQQQAGPVESHPGDNAPLPNMLRPDAGAPPQPPGIPLPGASN